MSVLFGEEKKFFRANFNDRWRREDQINGNQLIHVYTDSYFIFDTILASIKIHGEECIVLLTL